VIPQVLETAVDANPLLFLPLCQIKTASKGVVEEEDPSKAKLVVNDHLAKLVVRKIKTIQVLNLCLSHRLLQPHVNCK